PDAGAGGPGGAHAARHGAAWRRSDAARRCLAEGAGRRAPGRERHRRPLGSGRRRAVNRLRTREGRWIRVRMGIICGALAFAAGLVVAGAHSVMIRDGAEWRELADRQRQRRLRLVPKRGSLYDRNGSPLAISIDVPSVSLDAIELLRGVPPPEIPVVARSAAERIAHALDLDAADV